MKTIDFLSAEFNQNPYHFYRIMRNDLPLYFHETIQAYVLSRYEDIKFAFNNPAFTVKNYEFQSQPLHGRTILEMDGQEHARHRSIVAPSIRGKELQEKIMPIIERTCAEVLNDFEGKNKNDFATEFAAKFPIKVISAILGLEGENNEKFLVWYRSFVAFISDMGQHEQVTEAAFKTKAEIEEYLIPIIQERRQNPKDDILSKMCTARIDGVQMTDQEIRGFISLLITAGAESTDKILTLMFRNLLQNPKQMQMLIEDKSLIEKAFLESLRFSPPTHSIMRITSEEVEVSGGKIPANSQVIMWVGAAQRDERQFEKSEEFDILRTDLDWTKGFAPGANHIAFGGGRHFCVGSMLAKAEIDVAFRQIFEKFKNIRLVPNQNLQESGIFTRGITNMEIEYDCN
jgi:pulcherriminic acid synthase